MVQWCFNQSLYLHWLGSSHLREQLGEQLLRHGGRVSLCHCSHSWHPGSCCVLPSLWLPFAQHLGVPAALSRFQPQCRKEKSGAEDSAWGCDSVTLPSELCPTHSETRSMWAEGRLGDCEGDHCVLISGRQSTHTDSLVYGRMDQSTPRNSHQGLSVQKTDKASSIEDELALVSTNDTMSYQNHGAFNKHKEFLFRFRGQTSYLIIWGIQPRLLHYHLWNATAVSHGAASSHFRAWVQSLFAAFVLHLLGPSASCALWVLPISTQCSPARLCLCPSGLLPERTLMISGPPG